MEVPPELAEALSANPEAVAAWAKLSYSRQRAHAEPIAKAKAPETKARRVQKIIDELLG